MEARRGKGLKKSLDPESGKGPGANTMNGGKGQEITGVSLPADGKSRKKPKNENYMYCTKIADCIDHPSL
jgi:hypothetical protein